jgi:carotenoid cleavage dioxygenase-like enzyme
VSGSTFGRIALIPRNGTDRTTWIETEPWFVWHFANAFEHGGTIVVDFPWWDHFSLPGRRRCRTRAPSPG